MSTVGLEQAVSIPLPTSPPADGDTPLAFPQAGPVEPGNRDPVDENSARSIHNEFTQAEDKGDEDDSRDVDGVARVISVCSPQLAASSGDTTAHDEPGTGSKTTGHHSIQDTGSTLPSIPSTPAAKPGVSPEVHSPPPRRDSLTPSTLHSPNGHMRPSVQHVETKHANGRPSMQSTPSRPSSAASHRRSLTISKGRTVSAVLVTSALETIAASREAKRSEPLRESVKRALEMVKLGEGGDRPRVIFEPLRLACETRNEKLMIASLDCISKLISYSFFVEPLTSEHAGAPPSPPPSPGPNSRHSTSSVSHPQVPGPTLVDLVVHTITSCHTESTPDTVSLQIVKALLSLVLSATVLVHQSSLLKAVRTVYNIFLLSMDPINQTVAQGGLTQMVNHVFTRCKLDGKPDGSSLSRSDSSSTLSSKMGDRKSPSNRRSFTPSSPLSMQRPLSPPSSADHSSIAQRIESAAGLADQPNGSVDTPDTDTIELSAESFPEDHLNGSLPHLSQHLQ